MLCESRRVYSFALVLALLLGGKSAEAESAVWINEIRIDQPGVDKDEYFELLAPPGTDLSEWTYLVIGDDGSNSSGYLEAVIPLSGVVGPSGYFLVAESTFALGTANLVANLNFENDDNVTHLLVRGFSGAVNTDLDTDDDGVLDSTPWTSIQDGVAVLKSTTGGDLVYYPVKVGPNGSFAPGHVFRCGESSWEIGEFSLGVDDTPGMENNCDGQEEEAVAIYEIQGTGDESLFLGQSVVVEGVVVGDFQGNDALKGFFLQDPVGDGDPFTSDGIFVYSQMDVGVGDLVRVSGRVAEYQGMTQIAGVSSVEVLGSSLLPAPVALELPVEKDGDLERYEGMLVTIDEPLLVAQTYFLGRYGQLTLASADDQGELHRLVQPTDLFPAGSPEALALANENARRLLFLDDGQEVNKYGDNPSPVPYIGPAPGRTLRAGDRVTALTGILQEGRINSAPTPGLGYRIHPTQEPTLEACNPRPDIPHVQGKVRVAGVNLLNYFSTLDEGPYICGPNADMQCRGADSASELSRQESKLVTALVAMDADIVAFMELENNGQAEGSALGRLVGLLNSALGDELYAAVDTGLPFLGGDAISVGLIYAKDRFAPLGQPATLDTGAFDQNLSDGGRNRQPLAQTFKELETDNAFTVVVIHLKSKRPPSSPLGTENDDQGDGQGGWNARRVEAVLGLAQWLSSDPTGSEDEDFMIIGDFNAYSSEDPLLTLEDHGYSSVMKALKGEQGYSYIFDGMSGSLDHAVASPSMLAQIVDIAHWHINADEPEVLSYNEEYNSGSYFTSDPVRFSDHDPCIVGLNLGSDTETDGETDTGIGLDTEEDDTDSGGQSDSESTSGEVDGDIAGGTETDESSSVFGDGCGLSLVGGDARQTNSLLKALVLFQPFMIG